MLACMDGLDSSNNGVIVMGATNRYEILDGALTRPGRFDRVVRCSPRQTPPQPHHTLSRPISLLYLHIPAHTSSNLLLPPNTTSSSPPSIAPTPPIPSDAPPSPYIPPHPSSQVRIPLPDDVGRAAILKVHTRKLNLAPDVVLEQIATITPSMSGAELASLTNEAAIRAVRRGANVVNMEDFKGATEFFMTSRSRLVAVVWTHHFLPLLSLLATSLALHIFRLAASPIHLSPRLSIHRSAHVVWTPLPTHLSTASFASPTSYSQ